MKTIFSLPVASTSLEKEPIFSMHNGRTCSLEYSYQDGEAFRNERLNFEGVEAFRCVYYAAVDLELVSTYDKVSDLGDTNWLQRIVSNLSSAGMESVGLKHLAIFFDDGPSYEFICRQLRADEI